MRILLVALGCFFAAVPVFAGETPSQFMGRWVGIAEFGNSRYALITHHRALLTIEVDPQGVITNGAIRDFAGHALAGFFGQLDADGRITTSVSPIPEGSTAPELRIKLGRTTGNGTYRSRFYDRYDFRSTIRLWRETKPSADGQSPGSSSSGTSFVSVFTVNGIITNNPVIPNPPAPSDK